MPEKIWKTVASAMIEEFELEPGQMVPEARIKDDLGLDSLDVVDMVIVLETAFDFKIQDKAALKKIITMSDVVDFIVATMAAEKVEAAGG
jgi:acyl carrier protein